MSQFKIFPKNALISNVDINVLKQSAIIAHLYYEDHFDKNLKYLEAIDQNIDIYIVTANKKILEKFNEAKRNSNIKTITKPNRGRDFGALLVASKKIVQQYEYICFVHDKKGNQITKDFGDIWENSFFESMLGSDTYVKNIISFFYNNENVGLLSCPYPLHNVSLGFKGYTWKGNLSNSINLLNKLGIIKKIDKYIDSMTIGSCFWFRKQALSKLFEHNFDYKDFPEEPMPLDLSISHSLERIIDVISKDSMYINYYILSDENAADYLGDYEDNLRKTLYLLKRLQAIKTTGIQLDLNESIESLDNQLEFNDKKYDSVYILSKSDDFYFIDTIIFEYASKGIVIDGQINIRDKDNCIFNNNSVYFVCEENNEVKEFVKSKKIKNYTFYENKQQQAINLFFL